MGDEYEVNFERNVFPFIIDDEKTCTTRLLLIFYGFRFSRLVVIVIKTLMPCEWIVKRDSYQIPLRKIETKFVYRQIKFPPNFKKNVSFCQTVKLNFR